MLPKDCFISGNPLRNVYVKQIRIASALKSGMHKVLPLISILMLQVCADAGGRPQKCPSVSTGEYLVQYSSHPNERPSVMDIDGDNYRMYQSARIVDSGKIKSLTQCIYIFKSSMSRAVDTTGIAALINRSYGPTCVEISGAVADTIFFRTTYSGNLHITQNEGRFVKISPNH